MNLPNPKEESFDTKGIEEGRSKVVGLKEKLVGGFSRVNIWAFSTNLTGFGFWLGLLVGNLYPKGYVPPWAS